MHPSTFRNSKGELVDLRAFPATQVKNAFSAVLDQAAQDGAVAITRHDQPRAVLMSYAEFESLMKLRSPELNELTTEFDALLAGMQTAGARKGMKDAFDASPARLGRAAAKAAGVASVSKTTPAARAAAPTATEATRKR